MLFYEKKNNLMVDATTITQYFTYEIFRVDFNGVRLDSLDHSHEAI